MWLWGQFIDHDLALSETGNESLPIHVPRGDPVFDLLGSGNQSLPFFRSLRSATPSQDQLNFVTAALDASMIYGSGHVRASALKSPCGGHMRTSAGNMLPLNHHPSFSMESMFTAGDVRVNEHVGLSAMHGLWVREHNRWAQEIRLAGTHLSDEQVFQRARVMVEAEIQAITFYEWLPMLLGRTYAPGAYHGYNASLSPAIWNEFATAAFRIGHSLVSIPFPRMDTSGRIMCEGNMTLRETFNAPWLLMNGGGMEPILAGLSHVPAQRLDAKVVDDLRNFLFDRNGVGGMDLVALNIQRGRDHGLPDYNTMRVHLGLSPAHSFVQVTLNTTLQSLLTSLYLTPSRMDLWVGILCEDPVADSLLGQLGSVLIRNQFALLRDSDRFWFERRLPTEVLTFINSLTLGDVLQQNTGQLFSRNVFQVASARKVA